MAIEPAGRRAASRWAIWSAPPCTLKRSSELAVQRERPPRRLAELGEHRERAARGDVDAVLGAVRLADQPAELGVAAAGDARVEPVGDRHLVELVGRARRAGEVAQVALQRRVDRRRSRGWRGGRDSPGRRTGTGSSAGRRACRRTCRRGAGRARPPAPARRAGRCRSPRRPARRSGPRRRSRAGSWCARRPDPTPRTPCSAGRAAAAGTRRSARPHRRRSPRSVRRHRPRGLQPATAIR